MSFEIIDSNSGKPIKSWSRGVPVEDAAKKQLRNLAGLPFIHKHVADMPDVNFDDDPEARQKAEGIVSDRLESIRRKGGNF